MSLRSASVLFFLVALFLCAWHLDHGHNDNTMARAASVASLVDRGSLEITPIHTVTNDKSVVDGHYYSDKAPLPTFFVLPFHWCAVHLGLVKPGEFGTLNDGLLRLGGFLVGSVPMALLIALAWYDLRRRDTSLPMNAALLAALPLFGSFLFVYSGSFYNHLPGALFSVLAARSAIRGRPLLTGLYGGMAFLCEATLLLLVALWGLQLLLDRNWKGAVQLAIGLVPAALGAAAHNLAVTGDPFTFPNAFAANYTEMHQQYGFGTWQPEAFLGLSISDYRGILFYMPALIIGLWAIPRGTTKHAFLRDPFILPALVLIAIFFTHATWWGGWTYGPRYIMASAALLLFATLQRIGDRPLEKWSVYALSGFGILCAFGAKATIWYSMPTGVYHPLLSEVWPRLLRSEFSNMQWLALFGVSPVPATLLFLPVFALGLCALVRIDRAAHMA